MCKSKKTYVISALIPLAVGGLSAFLSRSGMADYKLLRKPPFSPPGYLFPVVWTILFLFMGISSAIIYCSDSSSKDRALKTYVTQLAVNFFWSIFFFAFGWRLFSFFWILLLLVLVVSMIRQFGSIQILAGKLQIPYLIWLLFAAYLNLGVWFLNR